jgi:peptide/nickel transport system ATP-binding protein/oligopeptide transport system ATP-binding protein
MDAQNNSKEKLIVTKHIKKNYSTKIGGFGKKATVHALERIDLEIYKGETLGLVGESGCGKSTLGRMIICLENPTEGEVYFRDKNLLSLSREELNILRRNLQIIFQDPYSSLNARHTIGQIIGEGLKIHRIGSNEEQVKKVKDLMKVVGLREDAYGAYPHEFSGGQRQRIGIARALALQPELIICDEPVSALDVSIQAQVINLLIDLQKEFHLTYLFISHDLSVVKYISDRIAVMYLGRLVELCPKTELYAHPTHPYTRALLSAVPIPNPSKKRDRHSIAGDVPSPISPPQGCHFHPRCLEAKPICKEEVPEFREFAPNHWVRCFA